jgi:hypothetical protein
MSLTQRHGQATFQAMAPVDTLDDTLLAGVLQAGGWSETAEDDGGHERLPEGFVATIVREHATQRNAPSEKSLVGLGIMVLALSVAEWGVAWETVPPPDPAAQRWQGPASIRVGKHLMSYALGGIGLPHLDVGGAVRFFDAVAARVPAAKRDLDQLKAMPNGFRYDVVRAKGGVCAPHPEAAVPMTDLDGVPFKHGAATFGGTKYCNRFNPAHATDIESWRKLRHWCRVALRRRDMQEWIIKDWINGVWVKAYNEVISRPHGTFREAFVVARIWNTSPGDALEALRAAQGEADPRKRIAAELAEYAKGSSTHQDRIGVMQRPGGVYDFLAAA